MDEEERNYCCLLLLLSRVGLEKLRQLFINEWNSAGGFVPWTDCLQNGTDLLTKFTPLPYERAKVQSGDTTTWDLSLFVKALLYSAPPFVPRSKTALFAGLKCLKETRNTLCHTGSGKIESAEFAILYADACNALSLVGALPSDFKKVERDVQQPWSEVLSLVKQCASQDTDILQGLGIINSKLDDLQRGVDKVQLGQEEILKEIQNLSKPSTCTSKEEYINNLKETKQTDLLPKGPDQGKQKSRQEKAQDQSFINIGNLFGTDYEKHAMLRRDAK